MFDITACHGFSVVDDQVWAFIEYLLPHVCINRLKWGHTWFNVKWATFNAENRVSIQKFTYYFADCLLLLDITACDSFSIVNDQVRAFIEYLLSHVYINRLKWDGTWFNVKFNVENGVTIHKFTYYFDNCLPMFDISACIHFLMWMKKYVLSTATCTYLLQATKLSNFVDCNKIGCIECRN